MVNFESFEHE